MKKSIIFTLTAFFTILMAISINGNCDIVKQDNILINNESVYMSAANNDAVIISMGKYSNDGVNWSDISEDKVFRPAYDGEAFVQIIDNYFYRSIDGFYWTKKLIRTNLESAFLHNIIKYKNKYYAIGHKVVGAMHTHAVFAKSSDGLNWSIQEKGDYVKYRTHYSYNDMYIIKDVFYIVDDYGSLLSSRDTKQWTTVKVGDGSLKTRKLLWDGTRYISIATDENLSYHICTSLDLKKWTDNIIINRNKNNKFLLSNFIYNNGIYIIAGNQYDERRTSAGVIYYTKDCINWGKQNLLFCKDYLRDLTWYNGYFYLFAEPCYIQRSIDGINWEVVRNIPTYNIENVHCFNNDIYCGTSGSTFLYSRKKDTNVWHEIPELYDIAIEQVRMFKGELHLYGLDPDNARNINNRVYKVYKVIDGISVQFLGETNRIGNTVVGNAIFNIDDRSFVPNRWYSFDGIKWDRFDITVVEKESDGNYIPIVGNEGDKYKSAYYTRATYDGKNYTLYSDEGFAIKTLFPLYSIGIFEPVKQ